MPYTHSNGSQLSMAECGPTIHPPAHSRIEIYDNDHSRDVEPQVPFWVLPATVIGTFHDVECRPQSSDQGPVGTVMVRSAEKTDSPESE